MVTREAHPVFLLGEVHSKLCRPSCEDSPAQKRRRYELNNMRHDLLLLLWGLVYLCHKFNTVHPFMCLKGIGNVLNHYAKSIFLHFLKADIWGFGTPTKPLNVEKYKLPCFCGIRFYSIQNFKDML